MSLKQVITGMKKDGVMPGGKCKYGRTILETEYTEKETKFKKVESQGLFGPHVKCPECGCVRVPQVEPRTVERGRQDTCYKVLVFPTHNIPARQSGKDVTQWYEFQGDSWVLQK